MIKNPSKNRNIDNDFFSKNDLIDAYRKLKSYFYYDNTSHFIRRQIAEFETNDIDAKLENLLKQLNKLGKELQSKQTEEAKEILYGGFVNEFGGVNYYLQPKSFENNIVDTKEDSLIITNRCISEYYHLKNFNFFIYLPIELHIINVLWIVKLGYLLDTDYCHYSNKNNSYCYANRLEIDQDDKNIKIGNKLFKPYHKQYQSWRDDCLKAAEDLLENHKKDIIIISLDIKRYYPSAKVNFDNIDKEIKRKCANENKGNDYLKYYFLTNILSKIRDKYMASISHINDKTENNMPIPIGMLASNVIANWYLKEFDKDVVENVKPAFYGRYVDDILIVLENLGECNKSKCDKKNCQENRKLSVNKILDKYFCGCNQHEKYQKSKQCGKCEHYNKFLCQKQILIPPKKSSKESNGEYKLKNHKNLAIQSDKVKLFVFDSDSSKALLSKFKENIRKHSSEFRFLPEDDRIDEDLIQEIYSIDYSDTINKLRSVEKCQLDKFKISSYLAKQLMLAKYSRDNKHFKKTKKELMFSFKGRLGLELSCFWDKVLTYFVLNNCDDSFVEFIKLIVENIEKIQYSPEGKNEKPNDTILEAIKIDLYTYLIESIYILIP